MSLVELGLPIGVGQTAEVFEWGSGQVLKLHYEWVSPEWIQHQLAVDRLIEQTGAPCPKVFEAVKVNDRLGIIYERVRGSSLLGLLDPAPTTVVRYARAMAALHYNLHQIVVPYPPSLKGNLREAILDSKSLLDPKSVRNMLSELDELPDGQVVCHGDLHPDNILRTETGKFVIIDWTNASVGHPMADVARTYLTLSTPYVPPNLGAVLTVALKFIRPLFRYTYIHKYRKLSHASMSEIMAWLRPVAAGRLRENIPGERDWLINLIRKNT